MAVEMVIQHHVRPVHVCPRGVSLSCGDERQLVLGVLEHPALEHVRHRSAGAAEGPKVPQYANLCSKKTRRQLPHVCGMPSLRSFFLGMLASISVIVYRKPF